jgi:uncharacterized protein YndB with AHSA1/START domain
MTIEVEVDEAIAAPPEAVYARVADIEAWPTWLIASGIIRVDRSATGPVTAGERIVVEQRAQGRAGTFEAEVAEATAPTRFTVRGRDGDGVSIEIDALVTPTDGGSSLHWSIGIGLPFRYRVFESMARPQVQRAAMLDVLALRIGLEAAPPA